MGIWPPKFSSHFLLKNVFTRISSQFLLRGQEGANGFPIALYRPVINRIRKKVLESLDRKGYAVENPSSFTIGGCDLYKHVYTGHGWDAMVDELADVVEMRSDGEGPLICIGHSFGGGVVSALAARRPELVHSLILVEPPLFHPFKRFLLALLSRVTPRAVVEKYHPIIEGALRKKDTFSSRSSARQYLSGRRVFNTMDSDVFNIFIEECLVPSQDEDYEQSVTLRWGKENEAEVYHRVPYDIPFFSQRFLNQYGMRQPGKYYFTQHKNSILQPMDYKWVAKSFKNLKCEEYSHSHFWPLENVEHFSDVMAKDIVDILVADSS